MNNYDRKVVVSPKIITFGRLISVLSLKLKKHVSIGVLGTMNSSYTPNFPSLDNRDDIQALWHGYLTTKSHAIAHKAFGMQALHACFPASPQQAEPSAFF
jgi:hypothetical protein